MGDGSVDRRRSDHQAEIDTHLRPPRPPRCDRQSSCNSALAGSVRLALFMKISRGVPKSCSRTGRTHKPHQASRDAGRLQKRQTSFIIQYSLRSHLPCQYRCPLGPLPISCALFSNEATRLAGLPLQPMWPPANRDRCWQRWMTEITHPPAASTARC